MTIVGTSRLLAILDDDKSVQDALQDLIQSACLRCVSVPLNNFCVLEPHARSDASSLTFKCQACPVLNCKRTLILKTAPYRSSSLQARGDIPLAVSAMKQGASHSCTKPVNGAFLLNSVERALRQNFASAQEADKHGSLSRAIRVSNAQRTGDIADVGEHLLNKQVAYEMGITE